MGGGRGVLSRSGIDMFHEKPWAILSNHSMAVEDGPRLSNSILPIQWQLRSPKHFSEFPCQHLGAFSEADQVGTGCQ